MRLEIGSLGLRSLRGAVAGCDAEHAADDIAKRLVVIDALDAPRVIDAAPTQSPGADPAGNRSLEIRACPRQARRSCLSSLENEGKCPHGNGRLPVRANYGRRSSGRPGRGLGLAS